MHIQELKRHLNIELDFSDEDILLQNYIDIAEQVVLSELNLYTGSTASYTGSTAPLQLQHAILLYAAHLYVTRQIISYGNPISIPKTFDFLINPFKKFTIN